MILSFSSFLVRFFAVGVGVDDAGVTNYFLLSFLLSLSFSLFSSLSTGGGVLRNGRAV